MWSHEKFLEVLYKVFQIDVWFKLKKLYLWHLVWPVHSWCTSYLAFCMLWSIVWGRESSCSIESYNVQIRLICISLGTWTAIAWALLLLWSNCFKIEKQIQIWYEVTFVRLEPIIVHIKHLVWTIKISFFTSLYFYHCNYVFCIFHKCWLKWAAWMSCITCSALHASRALSYITCIRTSI